MNNISRNGIFAIAGRPNVGKSTLANTIAGEKIAIVTDKPQTTRNRITAVRTYGDAQLVFIDTPGFHKSKNRLGDYMNNIVTESVTDVDAVILVVEPIPNVGVPEQLLIDKLKKAQMPAVLVINKIDTVTRDILLEVISAYKEVYEFDEYVPVSAMKNDGVDLLLGILGKYAIEGPALYPDDQVSDQPLRQIVAEIVREKMLLTLDREVPHGVAVAVEQYEEVAGITNIGVTIYCERDSHKGIIIGKSGAKLKQIGSLARTDIEKQVGTKVFLETWVKVKENWRQSAAQLRNFGYNG